MLTHAKLEQMQSVDIGAVDKDSLSDVSRVIRLSQKKPLSPSRTGDPQRGHNPRPSAVCLFDSGKRLIYSGFGAVFSATMLVMNAAMLSI